MTEQEEQYYDSIIGPPSMKPRRYIGVDKPKIERHYELKGRGDGYPYFRDTMDYDPRYDEDQERD